jgi:hypothetical protein
MGPQYGGRYTSGRYSEVAVNSGLTVNYFWPDKDGQRAKTPLHTPVDDRASIFPPPIDHFFQKFDLARYLKLR